MNLAFIKSNLNIATSDTQYDDYITRLYNLCMKMALNYTGYVVPATTKDYTFRNVNDKIFPFNYKPVTSVNSATLNGETIEVPEYGNGFLYFTRIISGDKVVVNVSVGTSVIPESVDVVINMMVEFLWKNATKANYLDQSKFNTMMPSNMVFPRYIIDALKELSYG